jgi:hypothetical protein
MLGGGRTSARGARTRPGGADTRQTMPWIKAADALPYENEQVRIFDPASRRIELGRYAGGAWHVEDLRDGRLTRVTWVTHWAPILDSEINDDSDDD